MLLALAWVFTDWYSAFSSTLVALAGFLFAPWTSLSWMYVFFMHHGDLGGGYAVLLAVGAIADLSAYGGSQAARSREYSEQR